LPVFNFPGGNLQRIGRTTSVPQFQTPRSLNFRESLAYTRGSHAMKFGVELLNVETGIRDVSSYSETSASAAGSLVRTADGRTR
jgi:hypothetical protein